MKLAKICNKIIEYGFYALVFFTPLIFNPNRTFPSFELFEWNKMLFVYFVTTVIVGAWIAKMILLKKFLLKKTFLNLPIFLFLGAQILATLFSIDPHVSIFGYYSRFHGGLLSTIAYTLLYFAFVSNADIISISKLLFFALCCGLIVTTYGILEKFGIDKSMWVQDVQNRVFSTLGQPNWLAAYLAILLPITVSLAVISKFKKLNLLPEENQKSKVNWFFLFIGLLFYTCLLFTKSRSGFLGFWAANGFFWLVFWWLYKSDFKRKFLNIFLLLNSSFLIFNFFIRTPFPQYNQIATVDLFASKNDQPAVESAPVGSSVIEVGVTDSADIRRIVWKGATEIIKNYPLFGTGPETFAYAYYKFRPSAHNLTSEWDFLYNRAHNEFLNIAATSGLAGFTSYLFLIVCVWISIYTEIKKHKELLIKTPLIAFGAAYLSILITNFFGFSVVAVGIYWYLIPALIVSLNRQKTELLVTESVNTVQRIGVGIVSVVTAALLGALLNLWLSDSLYAKAYTLRRQEQIEEAYRLITHATEKRPGEPVYHDERAGLSASLSLAYFENEDATKSSEFARIAVDESSKALSTSPQNVNFWKTRTRILYSLTAFDPIFLNHAAESIQIAHDLAPTDVKIAYNKAIILGELDKNQEAIATLVKSIALKPDYKDAYMALSVFYEREKQINKAIEILEQVLLRINPNDEEVKKRIEELKK